MSKKLVVSELTKDSFREFGEVISKEVKTPDGGEDSFTWWEKLGTFEDLGTVSINILEAKKREMKIDKLEVHKETPELVVPLGGEGVIVVVAPAGELDESRIQAFYLEGGHGILLNTGIRHFIPYPVEKNVDCLIAFKDATGANDLVFEELSDLYEIVV